MGNTIFLFFTFLEIVITNYLMRRVEQGDVGSEGVVNDSPSYWKDWLFDLLREDFLFYINNFYS